MNAANEVSISSHVYVNSKILKQSKTLQLIFMIICGQAEFSDGSVVSFQKTAVAVLASVVVFLKTAVAVLMRLC